MPADPETAPKSLPSSDPNGHRHYEWIKRLEAEIQADYNRLHSVAAADPQQAGHGAESAWARLLAQWLPPGYEVGTRKYIIPERGDEIFETDVIVFNRGYPESLREREDVLAGGVAAAFFVRLTADRNAITDAFQRGVALSRGLQPRQSTPRDAVAGPYPIGFLAHSHRWTAPASQPATNVRQVLAETEGRAISPRELLDYVCIANLGTWTTMRVTYMPPDALQQNPLASEKHRIEGAVVTAIAGLRGGASSPVGVLLASLLGRLALGDPAIKPLADGLRLTGMLGERGGTQRLWDLDAVYDEGLISAIKRYGVANRHTPGWEHVIL